MKKRTQSYLQQTYDKALYAACESGDAERVRAALKDGANPNRNRSVTGYSPLSAAMRDMPKSSPSSSPTAQRAMMSIECAMVLPETVRIQAKLG